jgi:hypothetical protein
MTVVVVIVIIIIIMAMTIAYKICSCMHAGKQVSVIQIMGMPCTAGIVYA